MNSTQASNTSGQTTSQYQEAQDNTSQPHEEPKTLSFQGRALNKLPEEILSNILFSLPFAEQLSAKRVCQRFANSVSTTHNPPANCLPFSEQYYESGLKAWLKQFHASDELIADLDKRKGTINFPVGLAHAIDETMVKTDAFSCAKVKSIEGNTVREESGFTGDGQKIVATISDGAGYRPTILYRNGGEKDEWSHKTVTHSGNYLKTVGSPDGCYLFITPQYLTDDPAHIWKIDENGSSIPVLAIEGNKDFYCCHHARFSPDSRWLFINAGTNSPQVWHRDESDQWVKDNADQFKGKRLCFSDDGYQLLSYQEEESASIIELFDYVDGKYQSSDTVDNFPGQYVSRVFKRDSDTVLIEYFGEPIDSDDDSGPEVSDDDEYEVESNCGSDVEPFFESYVALYRRNAEGKLKKTDDYPLSLKNSLSSDGQVIVSSVDCYHIFVGFTGDKSVFKEATVFEHPAYKPHTAFSSGQKGVAITCENNVMVYQPDHSKKWKQSILQHEAEVKQLAFDPAGHHLLTTTSDHTGSRVYLWGENSQDQWVLKDTLEPAGHVFEAMFSPDGRYIYTTFQSKQHCAELWELRPKEESSSEESDEEYFSAEEGPQLS